MLISILRLMVRPNISSITEELELLGEQMEDYIVNYEFSDEEAQSACDIRVQAIRQDQTVAIIDDILDHISLQFSEKLLSSSIVLKASLLPYKDYVKFLNVLSTMKDDIYQDASKILVVKLINKMAQVDFKKTFGVTRAEWMKTQPKDPLDDTLDAIASHSELPESFKRLLEEINGVVPFSFNPNDIQEV